ncbi:hypothetical protein [Microbacterium sp. LWH11-1.2]|uniref:hypothetical protein n=1 Tax=Microbacterium sp. LWH11-1.2 TaxID=3135258 RepID=UPI003139FF0C
MADVEIEDRGTALLPGAHRVVRALDPTEGPFSGVLVTRGDAVAVRVDATALAGWLGWRFAGAEHVAGPVDVIRRADGHDALLPWCTDRVLGFLVRRAAAGSALSSGECSTLVVSLLRGLDELGEGAAGVQTGVWWLTDGGRPILVLGQGEDPRSGAAEIIERLTEHSGDKALTRVLGGVQQGLVKALPQPRVPRRLLEEWEKELLAIAAPRPIGRESHAPERARDVARTAVDVDRSLTPVRGMRRGGLRSRSSSERRERSPFAVGFGMLRSIASGIRARLEGRTGGSAVRRTAAESDAPRSSSRRRALIVAGGAAAVVLAGGLLWPTGDAAESADAARRTAPPVWTSDDATESPAPGDAGSDAAASPSPPADDGGPEAAAIALLALVAECHTTEDRVCADAVAEGSVGVVDVLGDRGEGTPTVELVDEYGDVAVVRLGLAGGRPDDGAADATTAPEQMLVLERQKERWLVRDVYGVADQPE